MKIGWFPAPHTIQGLPKSLAGLKYLVECSCEANTLFTGPMWHCYLNPLFDSLLVSLYDRKSMLYNFTYTIKVTSHFGLIGIPHFKSVKTAISGKRQDIHIFLQTISFRFIFLTPNLLFLYQFLFLLSPSNPK